jgi:hypothetical protein
MLCKGDHPAVEILLQVRAGEHLLKIRLKWSVEQGITCHVHPVSPHKSAGLYFPDLHIGAPNRKRHPTLTSRQ